jgi:hypothetical protein
MMERWLRQRPSASDWLDPAIPRADGLPRPLVWFSNDEEDWTKDWWPPDYERPAA